MCAVPLLSRLRPDVVPLGEPGPHDSRANGVLRPVVFGANDGLVSNLALVMGVAGAAAEPGVIVLAGIAGLLAGAFSMAVGEYISVQSQQELLAYQVDLQRRQLVEVPEQERTILIESYMSKGFSHDEAAAFADRVFEDTEHAISVMLHTEVGLDARSIGSPVAAAAGSFLAFTLGAVIPLVPYLLARGTPAVVASLAVSLVALALLGLGISRLTRRPPLYAAVRQVLLGGAAAAVTYGVGALVGVSAA